MSNPVLTVSVPLAVPVPVATGDGLVAERVSLTLRRPKLRHAKHLALLIGADVLDMLMAADDGASDAVADAVVASSSGRKLVADVLRQVLTTDRLDGLTALIADLAGEEKNTIDNVDLVDFPALIGAFADFFPALRSAKSIASQAISQSLGVSIPSA